LKHCVITGGSSGLGKAVAALLLESGANVTIIARNMGLLEETKIELEKVKKRPDQFIQCISADVTDYSSISDAIAKTRKTGGPISALFSCAGTRDKLAEMTWNRFVRIE
jgi:3-dehydrosphinganine reductase